MMNTIVTQTTYDPAPDAKEKLKQVFDELTAFEDKISMHLPHSEISRLNAAAGEKAVPLSDDVYTLLKRSKALCMEADGRFDITVGPLVKAWGITSDSPRIPDKKEIQTLTSLIDIRKLSLDDSQKTARLTAHGMKVDLGGIAKGYACDLVREKYRTLGLNDALISLGGTIYSFGKKPDGSDYTVGIRDPRGTDSALLGTLTAPEKVISTTGDYERYFERDGKRYHHILDPRTGYPADTDLISVTVVTQEGALADFLSTTLFMAGRDAILTQLNRAEFDLIAVDRDKKVYLSEGIKQSFRLTNKKDYKLAE